MSKKKKFKETNPYKEVTLKKYVSEIPDLTINKYILAYAERKYKRNKMPHNEWAKILKITKE